MSTLKYVTLLSKTVYEAGTRCQISPKFCLRGRSQRTSPMWGGGGVCKKRTWGDVEGGRGSWKRDVPSVCGKIHNFFSKKTKIILAIWCWAFQNPILLGILFEKSTILPMLRRKNTLNEGGVSEKWHPFYGGVSEKWPWVTWGEGGVKNLKKRGDVLCERPLCLK